jgi:hypothetical protein
MIKLNLDPSDNRVVSEIRSQLKNVYHWIAGNDEYHKNQGRLNMIQWCVITVSALATGGTNAFAHKEKLGYLGASVLALLITSFVEVFYFTLHHGLGTVYKGVQRVAAVICYRTIQATMVLNGAVLCTWVVGESAPPFLSAWNRWSIVVHFTLALIGVSAVRDSDPVKAHAILELKAETSKQDIETLRKAAAFGNPAVLLAAKLRGFLDGMKMAHKLLTDSSGLPPVSDRHDDEFGRIPGRNGLYLAELPAVNVHDDKDTDAVGKFRRR